MALELKPLVLKSTPIVGTAGILESGTVYEIIDFNSLEINQMKQNQIESKASKLLSMINAMPRDPELSSSIEKATEWRRKVKIPRTDL